MTVKIDKKKCIGCGACVSTCPNEALKLDGGKSTVDPKKCKNAGDCVEVCPVQALSLKK